MTSIQSYRSADKSENAPDVAIVGLLLAFRSVSEPIFLDGPMFFLLRKQSISTSIIET